uniref:Uncharacterized protein n=1 Tax=Zea mays TaxID=4577 RepID=A0A804UDB7_MAIZE
MVLMATSSLDELTDELASCGQIWLWRARACCGAELRRRRGFYRAREEASMGQISEPECSLSFLSATKSSFSLTDTIIEDSGQLIPVNCRLSGSAWM